MGLPRVTGGSKNTQGCKGKHHLQIYKVKGRGAKPQMLSDLGPYPGTGAQTPFSSPQHTQRHIQILRAWFSGKSNGVFIQQKRCMPASSNSCPGPRCLGSCTLEFRPQHPPMLCGLINNWEWHPLACASGRAGSGHLCALLWRQMAEGGSVCHQA